MSQRAKGVLAGLHIHRLHAAIKRCGGDWKLWASDFGPQLRTIHYRSWFNLDPDLRVCCSCCSFLCAIRGSGGPIQAPCSHEFRKPEREEGTRSPSHTSTTLFRSFFHASSWIISLRHQQPQTKRRRCRKGCKCDIRECSV